MALLDRLLPAWRHSDPEVRAAAVRDLSDTEQETLATIAQRDEDVRVRRLAIKKLRDTEVLLALAQTESDEELRSLALNQAGDQLLECALGSGEVAASLRAVELLPRPSQLVSVAVRAGDGAVRRAALARIHDERSFAEVARRSSDSELGQLALAQVHEPTLLQKIAAADTGAEIALAAVERLQDPEVLNTIAADMHAHKAVRRRARSLLAIMLSEDHPIRIAERRTRRLELCAAVEPLSDDPSLERALGRWHDLEGEWNDIGPDSQEPELAQRFRAVGNALMERASRVEHRQADEQRREEVHRRGLEQRREICDQIDALEGVDTPTELETLRRRWRELGPASDPESQELAARFGQAIERCEQRHRRWQARHSFHVQLEDLVREAELLLDDEDASAQLPLLAQLEVRWRTLQSSPAAARWLADERALQRRLEAVGDELRRRQETAEQDREKRARDARSRVLDVCARGEGLLKNEQLKISVAQRALAAADEAAQHLGAVPGSEREALRARLNELRTALGARVDAQQKADEWERWANAEVQQKLIDRAETLLSGGDAQAMLKEIGALEQEWKRFAVAPREQSQALWNRFRAARDELRKRINAHLDENLAKKEALCEAAEKLGDATQWNATAAEFQRLQAEWKNIGPVRQRLSAALFERFRAPANRFFERRKEFLQGRAEQRKELVGRMQEVTERAEALADSRDWETVANELKKLQADARQLWRPPRPGARPDKDANALLQRFQDACQRFFERYRRRGDIELEGKIDHAEALVVQVEQIRDAAEVPPREQVSEQLKPILEQWHQFAALPAVHMQSLNQRMQAACDALDARFPEGLDDQVLAAELNLDLREKTCARMERIVSSLAGGDDPEIGDVAERLRRALAANTIGGGALSARQKERREEIDTGRRLLAKWQRLGLVVGGRARALGSRFDHAAAEFERLSSRR